MDTAYVSDLNRPRIDHKAIAALSDDSLADRYRAIHEVVSGLTDPGEEGDMFREGHARVGGQPLPVYRAMLRALRKEIRRREHRKAHDLKNTAINLPWTHFRRVRPDAEQFNTEEAWARYRKLAEADPDPAHDADFYRRTYMTVLNDEHYQNSRYQVRVRREMIADGEGGEMEMVQLAIRRHDMQPIHDWLDKQRIKDELVGRECEGVELFPARSRMMDTANEYHLWVVKSDTYRWPVGFHYDAVTLPEGTGQRGAKA